ncbi:hypothetical protein CUJ83_12325 [Methanocella sp. CWC-04]|uniref:DUF7343 domain-containing protein n=2 Tax=Methanooceanicella nereidis TaxID=2052831 RepID=A0AAP2W804_9EURY|nr:hypothetical protein [Methanocella sp. CWC-04]
MPPQTMVSKTGSYSFNLPSGDYTIIAKWGSPGSNALYAQENITITGDGDYIIDLILFPAGSIDDLDILDDNITAIVPDEPVQNDQNLVLVAAMVFIIFIVLGFIGYVLFFRKKPAPKKEQIKEIKHVTDIFEEQVKREDEDVQIVSEPPKIQFSVATQAQKELTLPEDLREIIQILEKNGGRMTQLDLRKALPYSEAKVSLMITDLENRGLIKKIKKGRGNVILLTGMDKNN